MAVKSSHLYLYSAFNNTNCDKATAQYQNAKWENSVNNVKWQIKQLNFQLKAFHYWIQWWHRPAQFSSKSFCSIKSTILLEMKCPQLSKPEATASSMMLQLCWYLTNSMTVNVNWFDLVNDSMTHSWWLFVPQKKSVFFEQMTHS